MDSKIIFIDFEEPSMEDREEEEDLGVWVCVLRLRCVSQGQYNTPQTWAFCPCPHINNTPHPNAFHLH